MATFKAKDGTQIYYKDGGAGKPVLFSHGWPLDGDMWDSQLNYLAERGFRTIAFDRRGFGRSDQPWNGYDYDTFASDINDLITTLEAYWACGTSIEATARRLFIHANTVRYRLGRIEDLTGYSPSDPRGSYVLRLAGTLGRLLD